MVAGSYTRKERERDVNSQLRLNHFLEREITNFQMLHQPSANNNKYHVPSLYIFRQFLSRNADGTIDASQVHSKECYEMWLQRKNKTATSEEAKYFHRTLSSHVGAFDGRSGFTVEEEAAILIVLRQKCVWPCFQGTNLTHGARGFRALGMHEKAAKNLTTTPVVSSPLPNNNDGDNWPDYDEMMVEEEEELLLDDDTALKEDMDFLLACQSLSHHD